MTEAVLSVLKNEHRAISAVLFCLKHTVAEWRDGKSKPPFALLHSIIDYMKAFPNRFHHPKEDTYLFPLVQKRVPALEETIKKLKLQHAEGDAAMSEIELFLNKMERQANEQNGAVSPDDLEAFARRIDDFVEFERAHARLEATDIIPAAREALRAEDWAEIEQAFGANEDPIFGSKPRKEFDDLFHQILMLAPAPMGYAAQNSPAPAPADTDKDDAETAIRRQVLNLNWI